MLSQPQNKTKKLFLNRTQSSESVADGLETIQLKCNNSENKFADDLRTIDTKQIHLQNRINELENVFTIASARTMQQSLADADSDQMCSDLSEKVRNQANLSDFNMIDDQMWFQVNELEHKFQIIQQNVSRCVHCEHIRTKMDVLREKVALLLQDKREQIQELADTK